MRQTRVLSSHKDPCLTVSPGACGPTEGLAWPFPPRLSPWMLPPAAGRGGHRLVAGDTGRSGVGGGDGLRDVTSSASQRCPEDAGLGGRGPSEGRVIADDSAGELHQTDDSGTDCRPYVPGSRLVAGGGLTRCSSPRAGSSHPPARGALTWLGVMRGPLEAQGEGQAVPGTVRAGLASEGCSRESVTGKCHCARALQLLERCV